jgi:hypothetical protein
VGAAGDANPPCLGSWPKPICGAFEPNKLV